MVQTEVLATVDPLVDAVAKRFAATYRVDIGRSKTVGYDSETLNRFEPIVKQRALAHVTPRSSLIEIARVSGEMAQIAVIEAVTLYRLSSCETQKFVRAYHRRQRTLLAGQVLDFDDLVREIRTPAASATTVDVTPLAEP